MNTRLIPWQLMIAILLVVGGHVVPALSDDVPVAVAVADDGDGDDDKGKDKEEKDQGDDKGKKEKGDTKSKGVEAAADYAVDVRCEATPEGDRSTCSFTIIEPPDGKKVTHLVIPEATVCAGPLDGDFTAVEDDPNVGIPGYRATGSGKDLPLTLVIEGVVATGGTATYWLKTGEGVFPATGSGLVCGEPASSATPPAGTGVDMGTVVVAAFGCTGVPADTASFDWFGACAPGSSGQAYTLLPVDPASGGAYAAETTAGGEAIFDALPPGRYDLNEEGRNWCHAESDNVSGEGDVVVESGIETTVWLFYCDTASRALPGTIYPV